MPLPYCSVLQSAAPALQSATPVPLCTTKCCASATVLQSATQVLLCTTSYCSMLQHHKVLLQYYSALQSTTPVLLCPLLRHYKVPLQHYSEYCRALLQYYPALLLCATKCDSSTTLYYKVLLQYHCTTQCYSSATLYYKVLLKYYKVLLKCYSVLQTNAPAPQSATPVLHCTTKYHSSAALSTASATPAALLKWSERELLWEEAPHVQEAATDCARRAEPGLEPMTSRLRSGVWYHYTNCPLSPEWNMPKYALIPSGFFCSGAGWWHGATERTTLRHKVLLQYYRDYCKVLRQYYSAQVLLCPTKYCSSTTKKSFSSITQSTTEYYSSYYPVLQRITPVLLRTTKCYSSTIRYYTKYYSSTTKHYSSAALSYRSTAPALQGVTPALLCTTEYYFSTTVCYKVLLQHNSVLQSATQMLLCTTKYGSSTTLLGAAPVLLRIIITQYHAVLQSVCYKVLLQYCWERGALIQSATPAPLRVT